MYANDEIETKQLKLNCNDNFLESCIWNTHKYNLLKRMWKPLDTELLAERDTIQNINTHTLRCLQFEYKCQVDVKKFFLHLIRKSTWISFVDEVFSIVYFFQIFFICFPFVHLYFYPTNFLYFPGILRCVKHNLNVKSIFGNSLFLI